mmetsp:Transcript_21348/g.23220  ORF Transcript_21348/g.23220 Transcript_21348/m.23220 type:complete len:88 (-) Transcript_21348:989-1252(-)
MVSLPVNIAGKDSLMVHFLVDTGGPRTEIPIAVLERLSGKPPEHVPSAFYGYIGGIKIELGICSPSGNHPDIPLSGQDFKLTMLKKQ